MSQRLKGRVAIVIGSSRGLGEYCALAYGREGAVVVTAARSESARNPELLGTIYTAADKITAAGGQA